MAQRVGPVEVDEDEDPDNISTVDVPQQAVGFVTGRMGNFLRMIEDEWSVIMFFAGYDKERPMVKETEKLVIFGEERNRMAAALKIMSTAETKVEGHYSDKFKNMTTEEMRSDADGFDCDRMWIKEKEVRCVFKYFSF